MKNLFDEVTLNRLKAKNRLVRSATWEGIANLDGSIKDEAFEIYDELASGGVGTIITGFTSVAKEDYYFDAMMRLSDDALILGQRRLVDLIREKGGKAIAPLVLGAYYRKIENSYAQIEPNAMSLDEVKNVRNLFIDAAIRAKKAGFDGAQIHAAHFFFLSRFISPAVNRRNDEYGGNTENRARILVEILKGIRKKAPDMHVTIKINSSDFIHGGLDENESLAICKILSQEGIDSIEVSGNGASRSGIRAHKNEGYFAPFAAKLAELIDTPAILVGGMRSLEEMNKILNETKIELIALSRPLLREPDLPSKLKSGEATQSKCVSCNKCYGSHSHRCVYR